MKTSTARIPAQRQPVEPKTDGLGQVTALVRDGFAGLPTTYRSPRRSLLWTFWLTGIVGDAWSTIAMIRGGPFEEANPAAAVCMRLVGITGYVLLASAVCLLMAVVSTGRPSGPVARLTVGFLLLVAAGKVYVAVGNLLLWRG